MSELSRTEGATPQRAAATARRGSFEEFYAAELPRLVFTFNRTNFGRLRQLIDRINAG